MMRTTWSKVILVTVIPGIIAAGQCALLSVAALPQGHRGMADKVRNSEEGWRHCLSPETYKVMREKGTEMTVIGISFPWPEAGRGCSGDSGAMTTIGEATGAAFMRDAMIRSGCLGQGLVLGARKVVWLVD